MTTHLTTHTGITLLRFCSVLFCNLVCRCFLDIREIPDVSDNVLNTACSSYRMVERFRARYSLRESLTSALHTSLMTYTVGQILPPLPSPVATVTIVKAICQCCRGFQRKETTRGRQLVSSREREGGDNTWSTVMHLLPPGIYFG
jgi:hypothetical protein